MSLYKVLGVRTNATAKTIKEAYRKLSKSTHPDMPGGSEESFRKVSEAFDVLYDPVRRKKYDTTGSTRLSAVTPERVQEVISNLMQAVIGDSDNPERENVQNKIIGILEQTRKNILADQQKTGAAKRRVTQLRTRFKLKNKGGPDPVGDTLDRKLQMLENDLLAQADAMEISLAAEKFLQDSYEYKVGPGPEGQNSPEPTIRTLRISSLGRVVMNQT